MAGRDRGPLDPPPWQLRLAGALVLVTGAAFAATFVYYAFRAHFTVPYVDDWSWLASVDGSPLTNLWAPHNEHVIVLSRLLLWLDVQVWGWPGYATFTTALLAHAAVAGVFVWMTRGHSREEARLLIGMMLVLTCSTYGIQGVVFPATTVFPLAAALAMLAIASLAWASHTPRRRTGVALAVATSLLAMACLTNGLLVPFILAALGVVLRLPVRLTTLFALLGLLGLAARQVLGGVPDTSFAASAPAIVRFTLAMLAGPVASISPRLAIAVGAVFAALSLTVVWRLLRARERRPEDATGVGILAFVALSAAMIAIGRAQFDPSVAAESRYAVLAAIGWTALVYGLFPPHATSSRTGYGAALLLPALAMAAVPAQVFVGRVWAGKADYLAVAAIPLTAGVADEEWIKTLHPLGSQYIEPAVIKLRDRGVRFLEMPRRNAPSSDAPAPACDGGIEGVDAGAASPGVRVEGRLRDKGAALLVVDSSGQVQGLARPAPAVRHPRAGANDFVWAELDTLTGRIEREGHWIGVSNRGAGAPYHVELLDASGRLVCEMPMPCCAAPARAAARPELVVRGNLPEGYLDGANCQAVGGWAWDAVRPDMPIEIRISVERGRERTVAADSFRQDLRDAGKGNGRHGFQVPASELGIGSGTWQVHATIASTGVPLTGSPKTVSCP